MSQSISPTNSAEALNQILQMAQNAQMNQNEKLMKLNVETALKSASLPGVGENVDITA